MSRLGALGVVAGLSVVGPLLEGALGGGRGWMVGMLLMVLAPSLVRAGGARLHPLDPETFVPVMYFLSAGYAPTLHLLSSKYLSLAYAEISAFEVAYVGSVGCALVCSAWSRQPKDPGASWGLPAEILPRDWAVIATGVGGAGLIGAWIATTGIGTLLASSYADTYLHEQGKGVLVAGWYLIQLAIVHCVARIADFRREGVKVPRVLTAAVAVMMVAFLFNTMLGRRGPILWVLTSVLLCLHLSGFRVRRLWLFAAAALIPVYAYFIEGFRSQQGEGTDAQLAAATTHLERIDNPFVIQDLEAVFGTLVMMVEQEPPILYYPGESWVNALLIQVPKPLWRDRPTALSDRYVQWAAPSFAREGGGYAFNMTAEGYLNLGALGALLQVAFVTGVFFFGPLAACVARPRGPLARALGTSMASFAYNQYRGELASILKITVVLLLATASVHLASAVFQQLRDQLLGGAPEGWKQRVARARREGAAQADP